MTTADGNGPTLQGSCEQATRTVGPRPDLRQTLQRLDREAVRGTCDTSHYRCRYLTWGDGPPLLFVPGLSSDARSFALLMVLLRDRFRCIAYDLPTGQGDGARLDRYTHANLADDAVALLDHLNEPPGYLAGFSFGSTIALAALHARPERWTRAVHLGGFARRRLAPAEVLLARLARHWQAPMRVMPFAEALLRRSHFAAFAGCPPEIWPFFLERHGSPPIAAVAHRALLIHQLDLRPLLPAITQPILLVSGEADPIIQASAVEELRQGLPNAMHVELRDCGHHALFTHPAAVAELMGQFLSPPACAAH